MKMKVSLPQEEVVAACQNYIEEKLQLNGPGWKIECTNDYCYSRDLEFTVEAPATTLKEVLDDPA